MKIGLLFGSFNPVHTGHLIIANSVLDVVDKTWFIISPQNPFKLYSDILNVTERLILLKAAVSNNEGFGVSEIELSMPVPSYTISTLNALKLNFPEINFSIIMGSDNYINLEKWKAAELIKQYPMFIYERPGFFINEIDLPNHIKKLKTPLLNISSTEIRQIIKENKSIRYLVPDEVIDIINQKKLYQR